MTPPTSTRRTSGGATRWITGSWSAWPAPASAPPGRSPTTPRSGRERRAAGAVGAGPAPWSAAPADHDTRQRLERLDAIALERGATSAG
ncbi:hypothetical protein [Streptomyces sp. enrichment culture]|uniref:hypothetical protein n=1 Tax=Streptomyces sp. enrichment culture TaxID=1795815 RepID=UPI003F571E19